VMFPFIFQIQINKIYGTLTESCFCSLHLMKSDRYSSDKMNFHGEGLAYAMWQGIYFFLP
jgi:hypothetical protein